MEAVGQDSEHLPSSHLVTQWAAVWRLLLYGLKKFGNRCTWANTSAVLHLLLSLLPGGGIGGDFLHHVG